MAAWKFAFVGVGLLLGGCMQATLEQAPATAMKPRDKELLANAPYNTNYPIPEPYQRHVVDYHRKEAPGTVVIDTDARYLYLVQANQKSPIGKMSEPSIIGGRRSSGMTLPCFFILRANRVLVTILGSVRKLEKGRDLRLT